MDMDVLGIPAVLETVLKHLDTKSLTVSRLVNKSWNYEACRILEERVVITFSTLPDLRNYIKCFDPVQNNADIAIQFQSFYFESLLFIAAVQEYGFRSLVYLKAAIQKFVELSGSQVTELKLCIFPVLPEVGEFNPPHPPEVITVMYTEMVDMIYNHFPNLQHLKLLFLINIPGKMVGKNLNFQIYLDAYAQNILRNLRTVSIDVNALYMDLGSNPLDGDDGNEINPLALVNEPVDGFDPEFEEGQGPESLMVSNFIKTLLLSAVHLQSLSSQNPSQVPGKPLHRYLFQSLPLISPSPYLNAIKYRLKITNVNLHHLCSTFNFPNLSTLILEINAKTVNEKQLGELFTRFRYTLRKLDLSFIRQTSKHFAELPRRVSLDNLLCLTLKDYRGSFNWEMFPALQKLTLENCSMQGFASSWIYCYPQGYIMNNCTCPSSSATENARQTNSCMCAPHPLTTLKIIRGPLEQTRDFCTVFEDVVPYCFKFLTSLTLQNVPPTMLTPIFQECKKLKRLEVLRCSPDEMSDEILCGIRESLLRKICPMEDPIDGYADTQESLVELVAFAKKRGKQSVRENAYIGNLEELQFLTLEGDFTDVGVLYGVIQCEKLRNLSLKSNLCTWRTGSAIKVALEEVVRITINGKRLNPTD